MTPKVKQTDQQLVLRGEKHTMQYVMLPHDIVSSMFQHPQVFYPIFVQENGDLWEALQLPDVVPWFTSVCFENLFTESLLM